MEVGRVLSPAMLEAVIAATGEAGAATEGGDDAARAGTAAAPLLAREGLAERLLGATPTPADLSNQPARHVEHGAETATVQTFGRPDVASQAAAQRDGAAQRDAAAHAATPAAPSAGAAPADFALPSSLLVQATLVGLQVESPQTLPLPVPPAPPQERRVTDDEPRRPRDADDGADDDDAAQDGTDEAADGPPEAEAETPPDTVLDPDDDPGCELLARTLLTALAAAQAPCARTGRAAAPGRWGAGAEAALLALAEQWQRGRCAVVACPQGADPDGAAWAYALRPRRAVQRAPDGSLRIALSGRRVPARLQWRQPPPRAGRWLHARMAKEHHPVRGRQLVPLPAPGAPDAAPCEVQLGPVLPERPRARDVRLRIDAVRRFWSALGDQWSVLLVVCSLPLGSPPAAPADTEGGASPHD